MVRHGQQRAFLRGRWAGVDACLDADIVEDAEVAQRRGDRSTALVRLGKTRHAGVEKMVAADPSRLVVDDGETLELQDQRAGTDVESGGDVLRRRDLTN